MAQKYSRHLLCIIPCGGSSSRLGTGRNKCIEGKVPPLKLIVEFWRLRGIQQFAFIVGGDSALEVTRFARSLEPRSIIIDRENVTNLAQSLLLADDIVRDRFILALGDCINFGEFTVSWDVDFGVGTCITSVGELRKNYLVRSNNDTVSSLIEKPTKVEEVGLCGMGTFFLHRRVFEYIRRLNLPNQATSVDLTGALQLAIGGGEAVRPVYFKGEYINVTTADDIARVQKLAMEGTT